jgi:hypothetical protein
MVRHMPRMAEGYHLVQHSDASCHNSVTTWMNRRCDGISGSATNVDMAASLPGKLITVCQSPTRKSSHVSTRYLRPVDRVTRP